MGLDAIGIPCKEAEKSIKFYSLLGLNFKKYGEGHWEAVTTSGVRIMLDSYELMEKIDPEWKPPVRPGTTLAFKQESAEQVDKLIKEIKSQGYEVIKEPWDAFWGQRYSTVLDVDGNRVDIFSPLQESH